MSVRSWLVVLVVAVLVPAGQAVVVVPAGASPGRTPLVAGPVERLAATAGGGRDAPAVVVDDAGTATAVWRQTYHTPAGAHEFSMQASRRGIGGSWSAPRTIGCPRPGACAGRWPQVGVSARGTVTAVWSDGVSVWAVRRPTAGGWTAARVIGTGAIETSTLRLAVARNGTAVAVWASGPYSDLGAGHVWAASRRAGGPWQTPVQIGRGRHLQVAASPTGSAVVVFDRDNDFFTELRAARFVPGRGWASWRRIGRGTPDVVQVAVGRSGHALAVWETWLEGPMGYVVRGREMTRTGVWGPARTVSRSAPDDLAPAPVIDGAGTESVVYVHGYDPGGGSEDPFDRGQGMVARKPVGGAWTQTRVVGATRYWPDTRLFVNRSDDLVAAFPGGVALRHHRTGWSAPVSLRGVVGILPHGSALRMWWDDHGLAAQRIHLR